MGRLLVVHAAPGAFPDIERNIALDKARVEPVLPEFLLAPGAGEKAAIVVLRLGIDDVGARQGRRYKVHRLLQYRSASTCRVCCRYLICFSRVKARNS